MTPSLGHEFNSWNGRKVTGQNFITEIRTTNRIILWPFGRLEVSDAGITLRAWPSVWLQPRGASWGHHHALGEQLAHDTRPAGAQREAYSDFLSAAGGAGQHHVGNVGARDQHHQAGHHDKEIGRASCREREKI